MTPAPRERRQTKLRDQLVTAVESHSVRSAARRERRRRLAASAAVLAAVITVTPIVASSLSEDHAGNVAVASSDQLLTVRLTGPTSPDEIEDELASHGVTAEVTEVPVSPSMVGEWVAASLPDGAAQSVEIAHAVLFLPTPVHGTLHVQVGRAARPGERYEVGARSAYLPGEALHCQGLADPNVAKLTEWAAANGQQLYWRELTAGGTTGDLETTVVPQGAQIIDVRPRGVGQLTALYTYATNLEPTIPLTTCAG